MKRIAMPRLRTATAVLASAAGIASLAAVAAPAASAATASEASKNTVTGSAFAATQTSAGSVRAMAQSMVPANQWAAFDHIVSHESSWNPRAVNAASGAYGLCQALPGSKMASAGSDWKTNPATQVKWALNYMNDRYGSPNAAWSFWQTHHWY
ncbi:transglycosylase SLT domain-containing protein [Peterkaempfera sp. SMS 1(5)a]|uniref:aggregation-promoting factor C-terminal-like domain-containing protein n=1 Tax=Peterkaempfera podocarpi TaxID=3232308 RepID=UPI003672BC5B